MIPQGTGVGISIVAGVIENSNGKTCLENEPGKGSTFLFLITVCNLSQFGSFHQQV